MRLAVTFVALSGITLAGLTQTMAASQVAPPGWAQLVGKTCRLDVEGGTQNGPGGQAIFGQGSDGGPTVELQSLELKQVRKITFTPRGGVRFLPIYSGGHFTFYYNAAQKSWTGNLSGLPAYLICGA
jgi:hypothetical protein